MGFIFDTTKVKWISKQLKQLTTKETCKQFIRGTWCSINHLASMWPLCKITKDACDVIEARANSVFEQALPTTKKGLERGETKAACLHFAGLRKVMCSCVPFSQFHQLILARLVLFLEYILFCVYFNSRGDSVLLALW